MADADALLNHLHKLFPDFSKELLRDILSACGDDVDAAEAILCDMFVDAVADTPQASEDVKLFDHGPKHFNSQTPSLPARATIDCGGGQDGGGEDAFDDVFAEAFRRLDVDSDSAMAARLQAEEEAVVSAKNAQEERDANIARESSQAAGSTKVAMGSWSSTSVAGVSLSKAGKICVDRIAAKFCWSDKAEIARLYVACGESEEVTEEELINLYPETARIACVYDNQPPSPGMTRDPPPSDVGSPSSSLGTASDMERERIAAQRRARDVAEIAAASATALAGLHGRTQTASELRMELTVRLAERTRQRDAAQMLHIQTRRSVHSQNTKRLADEVESTWRQLFAVICGSEEFRAGSIDLHGLNVEQALEVVNAKLARGGGGRVRFITGRGNNSAGRRAVLLPIIERHLRSRGVVFSRDENGGSVIARLA
jgi:Smr domain/CUE domain